MLGERPLKNKKRQESKDERWAKLEKRIERARARHELARLAMETIVLVYECFFCFTTNIKLKKTLMTIELLV